MQEERKVWIAYLTALPFGLLGFHKFYLRQPVMGIIYFFTGGLLALGWLYDLCTLPSQVERCNGNLASADDIEEFFEEEIEELEEEIFELQDEITQLKSNQRETA